jgi:nucleotide-binding universal stress UspA family protein
MFQHILVPTDGSLLSASAVDKALEPIRKELESVESVVIHCAAPFVRKEGAGCGRRNIVEFTLARVCAIRAI